MNTQKATFVILVPNSNSTIMSQRTHLYNTKIAQNTLFFSKTNIKRIAGFTAFTLLISALAFNFGNNNIQTNASVSVGSSTGFSFCNINNGSVIAGSPTVSNGGVQSVPTSSAALMIISKTADIVGGSCVIAKSEYVIIPSYLSHNTSFDIDSLGNPINIAITNNVPTQSLISSTTTGGITTAIFQVSDVDLDNLVFVDTTATNPTKGTVTRVTGTDTVKYVSTAGQTGTDTFTSSIRDESVIPYSNTFTPSTAFAVSPIGSNKFAASSLPLTQFPKFASTITFNITLGSSSSSSSIVLSSSVISSPVITSSLSSVTTSSLVSSSAVNPVSSAVSSVSTAGNNASPVVVDHHYYTWPGYNIWINPYWGAYDPNFDLITLKSVNGVKTTPGVYQEIPLDHGKVVIYATGNTGYAPDLTYVGEFTFPYVFSDSKGAESTGTETITILKYPTALPIVNYSSSSSTVVSSSINSSSLVLSSVPTISSSSTAILSSTSSSAQASSLVVSSTPEQVSSVISSQSPVLSSSSQVVVASFSISSPLLISSSNSSLMNSTSISNSSLSNSLSSTTVKSSIAVSSDSTSSFSNSSLTSSSPGCQIANVPCPCWVLGSQPINNYTSYNYTVTSVNNNTYNNINIIQYISNFFGPYFNNNYYNSYYNNYPYYYSSSNYDYSSSYYYSSGYSSQSLLSSPSSKTSNLSSTINDSSVLSSTSLSPLSSSTTSLIPTSSSISSGTLSANSSAVTSSIVNSSTSSNISTSSASVALGSISGYILVDGTNAPILGTNITLTTLSCGGNQAVIQVATIKQTDSNGYYNFSNLSLGCIYKVVETQPSTYSDSRESAGINSIVVGNDTFEVNLTASVVNSPLNNFFEIVPAVSSSSVITNSSIVSSSTLPASLSSVSASTLAVSSTPKSSLVSSAVSSILSSITSSVIPVFSSSVISSSSATPVPPTIIDIICSYTFNIFGYPITLLNVKANADGSCPPFSISSVTTTQTIISLVPSSSVSNISVGTLGVSSISSIVPATSSSTSAVISSVIPSVSSSSIVLSSIASSVVSTTSSSSTAPSSVASSVVSSSSPASSLASSSQVVSSSLLSLASSSKSSITSSSVTPISSSSVVLSSALPIFSSLSSSSSVPTSSSISLVSSSVSNSSSSSIVGVPAPVASIIGNGTVIIVGSPNSSANAIVQGVLSAVNQAVASIPTFGTLSVKNLGFKIEDPYTCGGGFEGTLTDSTVKVIKYELFKKGDSTPIYVYEVPVTDGKFKLAIDYNIIKEGDYKVVFTGTNSNSQSQSGTFEAFITNNCDKSKPVTTIKQGTFATNNPKGTTTRSGGLSEESISIITILALIILGLGGLAVGTNLKSNKN